MPLDWADDEDETILSFCVLIGNVHNGINEDDLKDLIGELTVRSGDLLHATASTAPRSRVP